MQILRSSFISLSLLFFSIMNASAYAENRAGALAFTLGGGYDYFSSKREMQNTGIPFVALGYSFTKTWGIEGLLGSFRTNFNNSVHDTRNIDGNMFAIDVIYRFLPYRFMEPHLLAGVGVMGFDPNRNDAHNQGNVNVGIGTDLFIDQSIAFLVEARDFYTIVGGKNDVFVDAGIKFLLDIC